MDREDTLQTNIPSSSLDEAIVLPTPSLADDFKQFQELILLQEVQESQHKLLDILLTTASGRAVLLMNEC